MDKVKKKSKAKEPCINDKKPMKKTFKCKVCKKAFSNRGNLQVHSSLHTDETFPCQLCQYVGKTKKYLSRHHRQVHAERNKHKCTYCGKFFVHPSDLRDHIMVHTGEKPLSCNVCGKSFRVSYSLSTHMLIHKDEKPFRCSFCEYSCRDSSSLRKHQNKHMGLESVYQCKICSKGYKSKWMLKMHVAEAHLDVDVKKVQCGQCDLRFKTVSQMNSHVRAKHSRVLACTCPVCGLRLASRYNLSEHMRRHMDERPFVCTHPGCTQAFKNKGCLQKHLKIHDPPGFSCSHCGRKFVRKSHAARHEVVMHDQRTRSVQCDYCGAKFYSKNYLLKHIQTKHVHKQKFKYTCDVCGLTTHNKPSIVMHLKYGHTNDEDLQCKLCDNKVVYKKHIYLKSHYWKTHNVKYKIDARRAVRYNKNGPKQNVHIKVEPIEAESYEEIELLDVHKQEHVSEDDNESLDYSKQVLSEDITALVLRDSKADGKEVDFDDFYIRHIMAKQEEKPDVPKSSSGVNKEQDQYVKRKIKHILLRTQKLEKAKAERKKKREEDRLREEKEEEETRKREEAERQEIIELRRVRELYNEKMKAAKDREKQKKEKVNIKYFKKKPDVSKTVTVIDDDDLDKESTENDITTNTSVTNNDINDDSDDDENTPLNTLITIMKSSVDSTTNENVNNLKKNSEYSAQNDKNDNNLNTDEKYLPNKLNENNSDTDNMDIDEDLNISNRFFIEGDTFINQNEVVSQMTKINDSDLSGNGDRVQNSDVSHNKHSADVDNLERLGGGNINYNDHTNMGNIEGGDGKHNNDGKQDNGDQNYDHPYVRNNYDTNHGIPDKATAKQDAIENEVTEVAKEIENNQQSETNSEDVGNNHGVVSNDNNENNDDEVVDVNNVANNENEIFNSDQQQSEIHSEDVGNNHGVVRNGNDENNDDEVVNVNNVVNNENEILNSDQQQSEIHSEDVGNNHGVVRNDNDENNDDEIVNVNNVANNENEILNSDQQQSEIHSEDVGNNHGVVRNDNDENNDDEIVNVNNVANNENEILNSDQQQSEIHSEDVGSNHGVVRNDNDENNDDEVVNVNNVANNENEILNSDSDFDKPLIERKQKRKKKSKQDSDYEVDDKDVVCKKKAKKMEFKTHQCYVCFKLYQTKEELIKHCQEHFDICNERTLGKCPICNHVSYKVTGHMRRVHKIHIKVPFNKLKDRKTTDGSRYCYEIDGGEIEVIPSIKILNKTASMEIDKKRREKKDKSIATTKLVKKGNAWIVEKEYLDLSFDELPELTDLELTKCKVTGNDIDRLGQISRIAKKKGLKMMFPCFECDKVCQNFSALKLHKRRHEDNPKPFAPRVKNGARSVKKDSKIKLDKGNRTALPKPIKTKHKCDEKLKKFFENNIRGGDIEFWQFLKIFNKMDREKVNDFKDLEERSDFGNHLDYYKDEDHDEMVEMAGDIDKYIEEDDVSEIDEDDEISDEVLAESSDD